MNLINIADIVENNGRTIRQNNLSLKHNIPIGTLVEVTFDTWFGDGACWKVHARLFVVDHTRDCDGSPLYTISHWCDEQIWSLPGQSFGGFVEKRLHPIEVTERLKEGYDALAWGDSEQGDKHDLEPVDKI